MIADTVRSNNAASRLVFTARWTTAALLLVH